MIQFITEAGAVLKIRVFQFASNCKAEFQAYESGRRHVENLHVLRNKTYFDHVIHIFSSLWRTKNVARTFSLYFENEKNEKRELTKNVTTTNNLFEALFVDNGANT